MTSLIIQGLAAAYLVWIGVIMKADSHLASAVFKVFPVVTGGFLAFNVYAQFMGWPV